MAESTALRFSLSAKGLPQESRKRYEEKLRLISCLDPFLLPDISVVARSNLPPVEASDIVAYLVLQTSFLTTKQFKARKSLEGQNTMCVTTEQQPLKSTAGKLCIIFQALLKPLNKLSVLHMQVKLHVKEARLLKYWKLSITGMVRAVVVCILIASSEQLCIVSDI